MREVPPPQLLSGLVIPAATELTIHAETLPGHHLSWAIQAQLALPSLLQVAAQQLPVEHAAAVLAPLLP